MTIEVITIPKKELEALLYRTASMVADNLRVDIESRQTPELLTKNELAEYLRCDVSKINRYMPKGLPFDYFGDHPRFRKTDIDQWLRSNERVSEIQGKANFAKG